MSHVGTKIVAGAFTLLLCASTLLSLAAVTGAEPVEYRYALPPISVAVAWASVATVGDNIYVIGGAKSWNLDAATDLDTVQIYNVKTGDTTFGAPMWKGVGAAAYGVGPDGKIYVVGGWNETDGSYYQKVQIYDPVLDNWTLAAGNTPEFIGRCASSISPNGTLYIFGGGWTTNLTLMYDTQSNIWRYGADQPVFGYDGDAVVYNSTAVYVMGGSYGGVSSAVRVYNPAANSWSNAASLPSAEDFGCAILARNGYIYEFGGATTTSMADANPVSTVRRYSVADNSWTTLSLALSSGRDHMVCTLDAYGRVLVVAGYSGSAVVATVDAFTTSEIAGLNLIEISSPSDGSIVSGVVAVQVNKVNGGGSGFTQIDFFVDGSLYESRTWAISTTFLWNTSGLADGSSHTLMARGYNSDGTVEEASVKVTVSSLSVEEQVADIMSQLSSLQAQLNAPGANLSALAMQAAILQAKLDGIIAGSTATSAEMNATFASLQSQLDSFQTQIDRVEKKADTAGTYSMVNLVLVVIAIVLLALMLMMLRKKP